MAHPDALLITAANKMRAGEKVTFRQNFSGRMLESYIVSTDPEVNSANFDLISSSWKSGFGGHSEQGTGKGLMFQDVAIEQIEEFLINFRSHGEYADRKADIVAYLRVLTEQHPVGDVLLISPKGGAANEEPFHLNLQERVVSDVQGTAWRLKKDRVASRGDEKLGLTEAQCQAAERLAATGDKPAPSDTHYREIRGKPLLMIHALQPCGDANVHGPIAAFGVSFPPGHYQTEIQVVANRVWLERMRGAQDDPDDDEDYDA
jgi:hypothetical protein